MPHLAIAGGSPIRTDSFPGWPRVTEVDRAGLTQVMQSGNLSVGRVKARFEKSFAEYCGVSYCIAVANGTVSLELILRGLGIGYGDEVILPPYTFIATLSSIIFAGATPVFADIDRATYNLSPADAERRITPRTKAIIAVAVAGRPVDCDAFAALAARYNLKLIIDAAQAVGAEWRGKSLCSYGDVASISCQNTKNLTCGEGGIILTGSKALDTEIRAILGGGLRDGRYQTISQDHGMTEMQASVLETQFNKFAGELSLRSENAAYLDGRLKALPFVSPTDYDARITRHAYHLYIMRFDHRALSERGLDRAAFIGAMNAEGIPLCAGYSPLYHFPCVRSAYTERIIGGKIDDSPLPESELAGDLEGTWLFQSLLLGTRREMDDIADAAEKIWEHADEARG